MGHARAMRRSDDVVNRRPLPLDAYTGHGPRPAALLGDR
jgi:hypothetical protein